MKKIAIYTSARSDYGLLRNFISQSAEVFNVDILVAGAHHLQSKGMTRHEIEADWGEDARIRMIPVEFLLEDCSAQAQAKSLSLAQASLGQWFATQSYDALVILGDRWELFGASLPAMLYGIPIAHISGGEVTEGVIDDCIRHAHTKLAHLHFAANEHYAENISRMGEEDWRITVSGECGLDSIHRQDLATPEEIKERFGLSLKQKFILVTYHPASLDSEFSVSAQVDSLLQALGYFPEYQVVLTSPGAEKGADEVVECIKRFVDDRTNALFVDNFGSRNYLAVLRNSSAVLGNSSSGLVEAASFGVPTVNVGNRQKNRMAAESVLHVNYDPLAIQEALERVLSPAFQQFSRSCINPYDPFKDGRNSERIVSALLNAMTTRTRHELLTKKFNLDVNKSEWNALIRNFK
ncbi:UDP-N-acetylglucosamine 2-epimerase [Candidatus Ferrigenium straubiae]|jgi:GDP/UDP-N,N'-diacetylbacillosamine 2-epimerase (hydrolysing)|uniref:UDP-N-acetylglucosamine 2-epimerase n=1 Tax=Candidatus Ferrigenium straubiae TaxID=2919506 RepID=UPI003F4AB4FD